MKNAVWTAYIRKSDSTDALGVDSSIAVGKTPLIAAVRCFVHSVYGDEVEATV